MPTLPRQRITPPISRTIMERRLMRAQEALLALIDEIPVDWDWDRDSAREQLTLTINTIRRIYKGETQ